MPIDGLWVFQHIPKTAGTSLYTQIATAMPSAGLYPDSTPSGLSYSERRDALVDAFIKKQKTHPVRFAYGHLLAQHVRRIESELPDSHRFLFVRHPLERLWSEYCFQLRGTHPEHREMAATAPPFARFVEHPSNINVLCRMIGGMPESATRSLELLATRYAFVGLTEHYGIGFAVLQSLLGFKGAADVRKLARLPDGNRPSLENVKAFELLNREDLLLYDSLSEYHVLSTMEPTGEIGLRLRRVGEIAPLAGYRANRA